MHHTNESSRERLRAMRSLAILGDQSALKQQLRHLQAGGLLDDAHLHALADAVDQEVFGTVAALIEMVLAEPAAPVRTEATSTGDEPELRAQVEMLEQQLSDLEQEEAELQRTIHAFNVRYRNELGPLVSKLLRLRKNQLEQSLYARRSDRQRRRAYNKAESQFEQFQSVLEDVGEAPPEDISDDEQSQLKATYRRASKLCHPDMVDASVEAEAREYFNALREAYQQNDLDRVEEIAETLEESGFAQQSAASAGDRSHLEARAERLRRRIASVEETIDELRDTKAHKELMRTDGLDAYFDALKKKLRREIRQLRRGQQVPR